MEFLKKSFRFGRPSLYSAGNKASETSGMAHPNLKSMLEEKGIPTIYMGGFAKNTSSTGQKFSSLQGMYSFSSTKDTQQTNPQKQSLYIKAKQSNTHS